DHHGFLANNPTIMARLDGHNLRRFVFDTAAVRVLDVDFPVCEETGVRVHAEIGADDMFHVLRPPESRWIDHSFDAGAAGGADVQAHVTAIAVGGAPYRWTQRGCRARH